jgi:acyl-CoA thioesterase
MMKQLPDPQAVAEAVRRQVFEQDRCSRRLGIAIEAIAPGYALATLVVRDDMLNGFGLCHGGIIATLADTAFAFACNSRNQLTLAAGLSIELLSPAHEGDRLLAEAREVALGGRLGLYDVLVSNQHGKQVALLRGRSHALKGRSTVALDPQPE